MKSHPWIRLSLAASVTALLVSHAQAWTQDLLQDPNPILALFRPVEGWRGVAEVAAVPDKTEITATGAGGILSNRFGKGAKVPYLLTRQEYGDVRIELEFMIPKHSNAGVYVMGRYEVQIYDSFGKPRVYFDDLGGIYQRFDPSLPKEKQGSEGMAPKSNAAKAPGEWQTLDITFRAPMFDADGKKLSDATFEKVLVNGILVQENATTTGPTRSSPLEGEAEKGPIAIQGDHGPIAIRGFRVTSLDKVDQARFAELDAYWAKVSRSVNEGDFKAYVSTCHDKGVIVSGSKQTTQLLAKILPRWEKDFIAARDGTRSAKVEFRFSRRIGDATTAHESGIFCYTSQLPGKPAIKDYIHLEALLVKEPDGWKILMENQKGLASEAEWAALKESVSRKR
ncbi:MAG: DUF1080 domain-containing protein [bacterium]